jgi:hypothetical protein
MPSVFMKLTVLCSLKEKNKHFRFLLVGDLLEEGGRELCL